MLCEHGQALLARRCASLWRLGGLMLLAAVAMLGGLWCCAIWSFAGLWPFPDILPQTLSAAHWMKHSAAHRLAARHHLHRRRAVDIHRGASGGSLPYSGRRDRAKAGRPLGACVIVSAADRTAGGVSVRPAIGVRAVGHSGQSCRHWFCRISSSSCPMCSCRCQTHGGAYDRRFEASLGRAGQAPLGHIVSGAAFRC